MVVSLFVFLGKLNRKGKKEGALAGRDDDVIFLWKMVGDDVIGVLRDFLGNNVIVWCGRRDRSIGLHFKSGRGFRGFQWLQGASGVFQGVP